MTTVALAILAHPDDAEFLCAGTLHRLYREHDWTIHIATMTPGDCGSAEHSPDEIASIRRAEGKAAAESLGARYHCLEEADLRVIYSVATLEKVTRLLQQIQPSIVFSHSPDDYHLDHEQTSKLVRAATFAAPIPNFLHNRPGANESNLLLNAIPHLFYCDPLGGTDALGKPIEPAFRIDIGSVMEIKAKALDCHASQRAWLLKHHGVDNLVESMREWGTKQAEGTTAEFAEGFRQHLGHSYPQDNILEQLLKFDDRSVNN